MNGMRAGWPPILASLLIAVSLSLPATARAQHALAGVWRNPQASLHLELRDCGARMCGRVVWASDKAKADARKHGTEPLVGAELLRDLEQTGDNRWRGTVFVPDLGSEVRGTIVLTGRDTFRARSCLLGLACKTQVWTRVAAGANPDAPAAELD